MDANELKEMFEGIPSMVSVRSRLGVAASKMEAGPLNTLLNDAIDEIERLQMERRDWFIVARDLKDALFSNDALADTPAVQPALDTYLRVRGRLEDPRDAVQEGFND